jgi:hypothetical protein
MIPRSRDPAIPRPDDPTIPVARAETPPDGRASGNLPVGWAKRSVPVLRGGAAEIRCDRHDRRTGTLRFAHPTEEAHTGRKVSIAMKSITTVKAIGWGET